CGPRSPDGAGLGSRGSGARAAGGRRARDARALPRVLPAAQRDGPGMTAYVATIRVRPKAEVRDPQGEAIGGALRSLGLDVADVRTGKEITVRFAAPDESAARVAAAKMGGGLLANPVPEGFADEVPAE